MSPFLIKNILKKIFNLFGLEVHRRPGQPELKSKPDTQHIWLKDLNIKTVFDIGANTGQFAINISRILPEARIYSFEPLKGCYDGLINKLCGTKNFKAFYTALGDASGEVRFYRNEYSPSSSILPMKELHKQNFPYTAKESSEVVKISRLDDIAQDLIIEDNILVKIDVQGTEDKVISGGQNLINRAKAIIIETSFQALYEGQPLFKDIFEILTNKGFRYMGNFDGQLTSPIDGSALQSDAIFIK
jgi:FkbM family methyltransferase